MGEKSLFQNPNYESPKASIDIKPNDGETGLHALDASIRIWKRITDAEELAEKATKESLVDALTGCYNRNYYEKFKTENFDPLCDHLKIGLVYADINNLKSVNDTMGHDFGDILIKQAANTLRKKFRKNDVVARIGGDEFVVICQNDNNDENFENNLNSRLGEYDNRNKDLDFAFGVAVYDRAQDENLDGTLRRADQRMYNNKNNT